MPKRLWTAYGLCQAIGILTFSVGFFLAAQHAGSTAKDLAAASLSITGLLLLAPGVFLILLIPFEGLGFPAWVSLVLIVPANAWAWSIVSKALRRRS